MKANHSAILKVGLQVSVLATACLNPTAMKKREVINDSNSHKP